MRVVHRYICAELDELSEAANFDSNIIIYYLFHNALRASRPTPTTENSVTNWYCDGTLIILYNTVLSL